jgi:hypothetical protein
VQRQDDGQRHSRQDVDERAQPRRVVHVARPVRGGQQVLARTHAQPVQRSRVRARREQLEDVHHHVPDEDHVPDHPLAPQRLDRRGGRAEQERGRVVGEDAVELLGHPAVVGAHPRLDVRDGHARLRGRQRARERRVRVPVDEHHVGRLGPQERLELGEHPGGLRGVRPAPEVEAVLRPRQVELVEEDP